MSEVSGISEAQIKTALTLLADVDLVERKSDGTYVRKTIQTLKTSLKSNPLVLRAYHHEMLDRAKQTLDQVAPERRHVTGLTLALSDSKFEELRELIFEFLASVPEQLRDRSEHRSIYQIECVAFPLLTSNEAK